MTLILATYNIKGGVGKTSAAVNLAYLAAQEGARTLLWDLDPQGASTYLFRVKPKVKGGGRALVRGKRDISIPIKGTDHERLDLLPADFSYRHLDLELDATKRPTRRLARLLAPLRPDYDYIFLDCPPSISLLSESVFEAADALLVPVIPATLSSRTFAQLERVVGDETVLLVFFSMVDGRKRLHREVMEQLAETPLSAADRDPGQRRRGAHGHTAHGAGGVRPARARSPCLPRPLARDSRTAGLRTARTMTTRLRGVHRHQVSSISSSRSSLSTSSSILSVDLVGHVHGEAHSAALELDVVVAREHVGQGAQPRRDLLAAEALLLLDLEDVHQLSFVVGWVDGVASASPAAALAGSRPAAIRASARTLGPRPSGSMADGEAPGCRREMRTRRTPGRMRKRRGGSQLDRFAVDAGGHGVVGVDLEGRCGPLPPRSLRQVPAAAAAGRGARRR